jgi:hypothetical protein
MEKEKKSIAVRIGSGRDRGTRWIGLSLGLVGVAALMFLAPIAQAAAPPIPTITVTAPYSGVSTYPSSSLSNAGCGVGKIVHAPFFDPTTGTGGFSTKSHATECPGVDGDSGSSYASLTIGVPIPVYAGNNLIRANWDINALLVTHVGGLACNLENSTFSYCDSSAYAYLDGYAYIYDTTNDTYWFGSSTWAGVFASSSLSVYCFYGNCSLNLTGNVHDVISTTAVWTFHAHGLNPAHAYVLEFSWYSGTSVEDYTYDASMSGASEIASAAMAGPGLGATLTSITIR